MKINFLCLFCLLCFTLSGTEKYKQGRYKQEYNISEFSCGRAWVGVNCRKSGFIDKNGKLVIPFDFNCAFSFSEGLARVSKDGKKDGFINTNGEFVIPPIYRFAYSFSEGLALVSKKMSDGRIKQAYIDKTGKIVIPFKNYQSCNGFHDGLASSIKPVPWKSILAALRGPDDTGPVKDSPDLVVGYLVPKDLKYGFMNKKGELVISPRFAYTSIFSCGLAAVREKEDGLTGFIDTKGRLVIPYRFKSTFPTFEDDIAAVETETGWGYIDKKGNFIVEPIYKYVGGFSEGLGSACVEKTGNGLCSYIYVDKKGKKVIEVRAEYVEPFSEGLAQIQRGILYGFIDKRGKLVIPVQYEFATSFSEGVASVKLKGKWYIIDKKGKILHQIELPEYGEIPPIPKEILDAINEN